MRIEHDESVVISSSTAKLAFESYSVAHDRYDRHANPFDGARSVGFEDLEKQRASSPVAANECTTFYQHCPARKNGGKC